MKLNSTQKLAGGNWSVLGGIVQQLSSPEGYVIERIYIADYMGGSVRTWDATSPVLSILCIIGPMNDVEMTSYVGMWVSVLTDVRGLSAASRSGREVLQIAVRAGSFSALVVVGVVVLGVAILYATFYVWLGGDSSGSMKFIGGIYTKAADVGADLIGKVEQGIPEDDPRNPAVIADLIGDNVGDCAAQGADLFESIDAEIISAMILGGTVAKRYKIEHLSGVILFPLVIQSFGLVISSVGICSIRGTHDPPGVIGVMEDPMMIFQKEYSVTIVLAVVTFGLSTRWMLYTEPTLSVWLNFALCGLAGITTAYIFVRITQYYTDYKYELIRRLALSSSTGHGANIIAGINLGLEYTILHVLVISISIVSTCWLDHIFSSMDGIRPVMSHMKNYDSNPFSLKQEQPADPESWSKFKGQRADVYPLEFKRGGEIQLLEEESLMIVGNPANTRNPDIGKMLPYGVGFVISDKLATLNSGFRCNTPAKAETPEMLAIVLNSCSSIRL